MGGEWKRMPLGDFVTLQRGHDLPDASRRAGQVPILGSFGVTGWHDVAKASGPGVTIGRSGASFGVVSYSPVDFWPLNTALYVVEFHGNDERFAYYFLKNFDFTSYNSGSAQPSLNRNFLHPVLVDVPPLSEQLAIAKTLGELDEKIELNRRMSATLESMSRALFKSWFVDFDPVRAKAEGRETGLPAEIAELFPDGFEESEVGEIPRGWRVASVGDEFVITMGQSPPGNTYNETGDGLPFYQGRADFQERFPRRRVYCTAGTRFASPGDSLISVRAPVGDVNMSEEPCAIGRGVAAARHVSGSRSYTYQFMRGLKAVFSRFEAGGTVFGSINKYEFRRLRCTAPPNRVVSAFEDLVSRFDDRLAVAMSETRTLTVARDALLPRLLSGAYSTAARL